MRMKNLLLVVVMLIFLVSFVGAETLCELTGCPSEWCSTFGDNIICDGSSSNINIIDPLYFCEADGRHWTNTSGSFPVSQIEGDGLLSCYQAEIAEGSRDTCCPPGTTCNVGTGLVEIGAVGTCWAVAGLDYCWDYDNSADCNNDTGNVGRKSVEDFKGDGFCSQIFEWNNGTEDCFNAIICGCYWNQITGNCSAIWINDSINCISPDGGCIETFVSKDESGCDLPNGKAIFTFKSEHWGGYSADMCEDGTYEVPCSKLSRLPFFGFFNIISVVMILIVFYCFRLKRDLNFMQRKV